MLPRVLAVVPARAGSKRLPQKNIKKLNGKPLITYTLETIKKSKYITSTIVSSDCKDVLSICQTYSFVETLERPVQLSTDTASSVDVLLHAVDFSKQLGDFDILCLLQPTSPLRSSEDVDGAIELYIKKKAKGIVSMSECLHSPQWATRLNSNDAFLGFIKNLSSNRSQDLEKYYQLNGAIYLIDIDEIVEHQSLFLHQDYYPYIMSPENSIDIDTRLDFELCEAMLKGEIDL